MTTTYPAQPIARVVIPASRVATLGLMVGFALLTAAAAQITIPIPGSPVPITGQTFAVLLSGAALGSWAGAGSQAIYWGLGAMGLPFYSSASGGWEAATGATAGYLVGRYIQENLPLRAGEQYVFVTASPSCGMDALQVMFDATTGKKGMFSTRASAEALAEYATGDVRPFTLVLRVNDNADTCDGLLVGFAWERTGQTTKLWNVAEVERRGCVEVLRKISGDASLVSVLESTGADPYELVWEE